MGQGRVRDALEPGGGGLRGAGSGTSSLSTDVAVHGKTINPASAEVLSTVKQ